MEESVVEKPIRWDTGVNFAQQSIKWFEDYYNNKDLALEYGEQLNFVERMMAQFRKHHKDNGNLDGVDFKKWAEKTITPFEKAARRRAAEHDQSARKREGGETDEDDNDRPQRERVKRRHTRTEQEREPPSPRTMAHARSESHARTDQRSSTGAYSQQVASSYHSYPPPPASPGHVARLHVSLGYSQPTVSSTHLPSARGIHVVPRKPPGYLEYPTPGYNLLAYPQSNYPPSGYPPSGYPPSGYPPSGYPPSAQLPTNYPPTGHYPPGYFSPGHGNGYSR
ncbi:hypothetical protein EK21DRAFT_106199 [Setomelanomma holmii]|uniref:Uncharacterized protein n=1 Tax=Setomelanomma holmii TaxID=210430 RepID=A0A9P4LS72_9PLEO|nr:hypothetical protein EK21DRAFT_106199 [Setomelanomma holmii]